MFYYFGYGSNINLISLRAKGVDPLSSEKATLSGWELKFNVAHWFRHEGGMGNIIPSSDPKSCVEGVVHLCKDEDLKSLDMMEAYGIGYDRITVSVLKADGDKVDAITYIGMPEVINDECHPTIRYLSIILSGAESAGLSASYLNKLKATPLQENPRLPDFKPLEGSYKNYNQKDLEQNKNLTALSGMVFDMTSARNNLAPVKNLFGGKDMTLFHVKRHDSSDGNETIEKVRDGLISESAKEYLNSYLHEYAKEFKFIGYFTP